MDHTNYFEIFILTIVISSFSIIQTLFGVGLLVFGTPTLLLIGYPFTTALLLLLPSSVLLSAIQILVGKNQVEIKKEFIYFSIPPMLLGLFIVSAGFFNLNLKLIIGLILVFITVVRTLKKYHQYLSKIFSKKIKIFMGFMGVIHGISNQGGGLLTLYFSTIYSDKLKIRSNIAFCYFTY
ncbi:MAG: TSUP family transporter, partial [Ignavibacteria bacterium]